MGPDQGSASGIGSWRPVAHHVHLVTTETADEVLVYDRRNNHIHHLNATAASVWHRCDGDHSVECIARESGMTVDSVRLALEKLADANLLDGTGPVEAEVTSPSRRRFLKKAAVAGGIALPVIASISAPAAADHESGHECVNYGGGAAGEVCYGNYMCCSADCDQSAGYQGVCN